MLNSNQLKLIALISMIIDHIGYFFFAEINSTLYMIFRCIGRIAMPLFIFLLVEGFFHTKNVKKYILRLSIIAIITQVIIISCERTNTEISTLANILFSFVLSLILLRVIDNKIIQNKILDVCLRIFVIIAIGVIYYCVKIDYTFAIPLLALFFYITKKIKNKNNIYLINFLYLIIVPTVSMLAISRISGIFAIVSAILMLIYNGKLGKKNKLLQYTYYLVFPLQYLALYIIKLIIL